jgi:4-hydroxybenzoate polyprenyltransferase/phosphoglycolate phosphatase-like HAD superfamily hydrolase
MRDSPPAIAFSGHGLPVAGLEQERPLCVDLDGTLVKSDTLVDSLLVMVRTHSLDLIKIPGWIAQGKAALKAHVAERVTLDVAHLPYNKPLIAYLEQQHGRGRKLYLATGADTTLAVKVAQHTGLFEGVLASDGKTNLTGSNKLESFQKHFPTTGFDYIGNARPDITLLAAAGEAMVANPDGALTSAIRAGRFKVARRFDDRASLARTLRKALRLHQWAKNALIFLPLILAHTLAGPRLVDAVVAFLCFSLCASATYILNDLLDIEADRRHPRKRYRPFASGDLSAKSGVLISAGFLLVSFVAALALPSGFLGYLALYLVSTLSYSFYFKRIVLIDVLLLSGLYTIRLLAGADAEQVTISPWLAGFSVFLFLSLAMVKRFSEMQNLRTAGTAPSNGRGYLTADIEQLRAFGTSAAYAAVVVFSFYISSLAGSKLYQHPQRLWLITPLMIFWLSRVWLLASRGELDEDPVIFAVTDKPSLMIGVAVVAIALFAVL